MKKNLLSMQPNPDKLPVYTPVEEDFEKAEKSERKSFFTDVKPVSYWSDAWRKLKKNRMAIGALIAIIIILLFSVIGPFFLQYSYSTQVKGEENWPPFWQTANEDVLKSCENNNIEYSKAKHLLGTDNLGRDNLVRLMYGTRVSLTIGIIATLIMVIIGSIIGSLMGYIGGAIDMVMMRIIEILYSVPDILVVLLLSTTVKNTLGGYVNAHPGEFSQFLNVIGGNLIGMFITFCLIYWVGMSLVVRGQILMIKKQDYVTAAKVLGASKSRIIRKHLLPNCMGQIIVTACLQIPSAIFLESFLSFMGMGVVAPLTSLGSMASDGLALIYTYPYRLVVPSILLSILILSFNLLGDGLRDALDPKIKN